MSDEEEISEMNLIILCKFVWLLKQQTEAQEYFKSDLIPLKVPTLENL